MMVVEVTGNAYDAKDMLFLLVTKVKVSPHSPILREISTTYPRNFLVALRGLESSGGLFLLGVQPSLSDVSRARARATMLSTVKPKCSINTL